MWKEKEIYNAREGLLIGELEGIEDRNQCVCYSGASNWVDSRDQANFDCISASDEPN